MQNSGSEGVNKISIKVRPGCKVEKMSWSEEKVLTVNLRSRPVDGAANDSLLKILSKLFKIPTSCIRIIQGQTSRSKVIEVISKKNDIFEILNSINK